MSTPPPKRPHKRTKHTAQRTKEGSSSHSAPQAPERSPQWLEMYAFINKHQPSRERNMDSESMRKIINEPSWMRMYRMEYHQNNEMVKEFYTAAALQTYTAESQFVTKVRGKDVPWSESAIRALLGCDKGTYPLPTMLENKVTFDYEHAFNQEVILRLGLSGCHWLAKKDGTTEFALLQSDLTKEARVIHNFVNSHIMPSSHFTEVPALKLQVIYQILTKEHKPDAARLIFDDIFSIAGKYNRKSTNVRAHHARLITWLCHAHNVPAYATDQIMAPLTYDEKSYKLICTNVEKCIKELKKRAREEASGSGGQETHGDEHMDDAPPPPPQHDDLPARVSALEEQFGSIRTDIHDIATEQANQGAEQQSQRAVLHYLARWNRINFRNSRLPEEEWEPFPEPPPGYGSP